MRIGGPPRWKVFLEFLAAGLLTWLVTDWIAARSYPTPSPGESA